MPFSNYQRYLKDGKYIGPGRSEKRFGMINWDLVKGQDVLDLGCANGMLAIESKKRGAKKVLGADKDDCIPSVRQMVREANIDVEFLQVDIESQEFKRTCPMFDITFYCSMGGHMHDGVEMLRWVDRHTKRVLYFESNLGENNKGQIEGVKKYTSFDSIKFLGQTNETPEEGTRYMWWCARTGRENQIPEWRDVPITLIPIEEMDGTNPVVCERLQSNEYYNRLRENIKLNGLVSPLIYYKNPKKGPIYRGIEGGKRFCILKELGYKSIPCKIVSPLPYPPLDITKP